MNILITGGAGFIGSHIVEALIDKYDITVVDDLSTGKMENIDTKAINFIKGDISNKKFVDSLFNQYEFDYIIHLAAIASVQESILNPLRTHEINNTSTIYLIEKARKQSKKLKRFIFSSSAAVYGDENTLPKSENSVIAPLTPYAIDKYSSEQFLVAYNRLYEVPIVVFRFFNVFGPRQNPESPYSGVLSIFANRFINNKEPKITIFGDGEQSRDFIYVKDIVNAILLAIDNEEMVGNIYNLGMGKEITLNQIITIFENITEKKAKITFKDTRAGDIKRSYSNITALKRVGFVHKFTLELGLKIYINYLINKITVIKDRFS